MIVCSYELKPWIPRKNNMGADFQSYTLTLNEKPVSQNIPSLELEGDLLQIEACDECFEIGCSSQGYVQVLKQGDFYIWKEPLILDYRPAFDKFTAYGLKYGTIIWPEDLYKKLLIEFNIDECNHKAQIPDQTIPLQVFDLWRLNGAKIMSPESIDSSSLEQIEETFIGMYSEKLDDQECKRLYSSVKTDLIKTTNISLVHIPEQIQKVTAMLDILGGYAEWDFMYMHDNNLYYPIGDGLGFVSAT